MEADFPRSIEDQMDELMNVVKIEQSRTITEQDICRILYLRYCCIKDDHLEPFNYEHLEEAHNRIVGRLRRRKEYLLYFTVEIILSLNQVMMILSICSFYSFLEDVHVEIIKSYKESLRYAIVDYILLDPDERKRFSIASMPVEFPILHIRAPIPWHQSKIMANNYIEHNLFIGNEILRDIRDLWFAK